MKALKLVFFSGIVLCACSVEKKDTPIEEENTPTSSLSVECYQYVQNKDTVQLQLNIDDKNVTGFLKYSFFEKDKSSGELKGRIEDSLLIADYTFQAEGQTSVREVIFKMSEDGWIEGYGPIEESNGKIKMKSLDSLDYSLSKQLRPIACN